MDDVEELRERAETAEKALSDLLGGQAISRRCEVCGAMVRARSAARLPLSMDAVVAIMNHLSGFFDDEDEAVMDTSLGVDQIGAVRRDHVDGCPKEKGRS